MSIGGNVNSKLENLLLLLWPAIQGGQIGALLGVGFIVFGIVLGCPYGPSNEETFYYGLGLIIYTVLSILIGATIKNHIYSFRMALWLAGIGSSIIGFFYWFESFLGCW